MKGPHGRVEVIAARPVHSWRVRPSPSASVLFYAASPSISTASFSTPSRSTSPRRTASWPQRGVGPQEMKCPLHRRPLPRHAGRHHPKYGAWPTTPTTTSTRLVRKCRGAFGGPLTPPPGALELIERLADHGVPRAVGSSSVHAWVDQFSPTSASASTSPSSSAATRSPTAAAPDIFLRCAELLSFPPSAAL